jgi:predicted amidohydrolase YtcJ
MRAFILLTTLICSAAAQSADLILTNGRIYAGDKQLGSVKSLAVRDGKVAATGDKSLSLKGERTQIIDLRGAFVMPGFNDAHLHLANGGFEKLNVNLIGTRTLAEMQSRIAERVKTAKPGEWITGRGWDHTKWDVKETPTRADIDKVTGDHPAAFTRVDGHIAIVNSAALKAAGITRETKDPEGGKVDRDSNGEATGILRETAMALVGAKIPPPTPEQRRRAIELALAEAAQWGSPPPRTTPVGKTSSSTNNCKRKVSSRCASASGCPSTRRLVNLRKCARTTMAKIRCSTPGC